MGKKRKTKPQSVKQTQAQAQARDASVESAEFETDAAATLAPELERQVEAPATGDDISAALEHASGALDATTDASTVGHAVAGDEEDAADGTTVSLGEYSTANGEAQIPVDVVEPSAARAELTDDVAEPRPSEVDAAHVDGTTTTAPEPTKVPGEGDDQAHAAPYASISGASTAQTADLSDVDIGATVDRSHTRDEARGPALNSAEHAIREADAADRLENKVNSSVDVHGSTSGGELDITIPDACNGLSEEQEEVAMGIDNAVGSGAEEAAELDIAAPGAHTNGPDESARPPSPPLVGLDDYRFIPSEAHISDVSMLPDSDDDLDYRPPSRDAPDPDPAVSEEQVEPDGGGLAGTQLASQPPGMTDAAESRHGETDPREPADDDTSPSGVSEEATATSAGDSDADEANEPGSHEQISAVSLAEVHVADPSSTASASSSSVPSPSPSPLAAPVMPTAPEREAEPEPGFYSHKPSIPASRPIAVPFSPTPYGEDPPSSRQVDEDGFESMPISTTPPAPSIASPDRGAASPSGSGSRPENGKRPSWASLSFGRRKSSTDRSGHAGSEIEGSERRASTPRTTVDGSEADSGQSRAESPRKEDVGDKVGEPSKPRRHAPPAHPFPFPIPPSPRSAAKDLPGGTAQNDPPHAGPSHAGPSNGADQSVSNEVKDHGIGVRGVSAFERVMNHTRPSHLPPKPREEDDTHYHQWEEMMATARKHEEERRRASDARRAERERRLSMNTPRWERLLGDPGFSVAGVQRDAELRRIWFKGVPTYLRGKAWSLAVGNPLARSKDAYRTYTARARKAIDSGRFPKDTLDAIERDMDATLPQLKLFVEGSPLRADLHELLCAWVVYRSDDGLGYAPYISHIAAMFLIPSPPNQAFLNLINFLSRPCPSAFVCEIKDEIEAFYRVLENLQADTFPKIFANCKNLGLRLPESYFRSVLVEQVPFEAVCRLWDQIMLDGDGYIFRASLAIFGFLEPRLYYPDKDEIRSVLEGTNRATAAITERERERARMRGEAFDEALDGRLSVFGLSEEALFGWLEQDGWREARYERLVTREMPD